MMEVPLMTLKVELDLEEDGRWLADVVDVPGAMAYGETRDVAAGNAEAIALRAIADQVEHREIPRPDKIEFSLK